MMTMCAMFEDKRGRLRMLRHQWSDLGLCEDVLCNVNEQLHEEVSKDRTHENNPGQEKKILIYS